MAEQHQSDEPTPQTADMVENPDDGAEGRASDAGSDGQHEQGEKMAAPSYSDDEDRLTGNNE